MLTSDFSPWCQGLVVPGSTCCVPKCPLMVNHTLSHVRLSQMWPDAKAWQDAACRCLQFLWSKEQHDRLAWSCRYMHAEIAMKQTNRIQFKRTQIKRNMHDRAHWLHATVLMSLQHVHNESSSSNNNNNNNWSNNNHHMLSVSATRGKGRVESSFLCWGQNLLKLMWPLEELTVIDAWQWSCSKVRAMLKIRIRNMLFINGFLFVLCSRSLKKESRLGSSVDRCRMKTIYAFLWYQLAEYFLSMLVCVVDYVKSHDVEYGEKNWESLELRNILYTFYQLASFLLLVH